MSQNLSHNEQVVFEVIQEFLESNRTFEMEKVLPIIISRFARSSININKEGIKNILISLIQKKVVIERSKFSRDTVLNSPKRKKIYEYIKENPGYNLNRIASELIITNYVVYCHLNTLLKFNFIKKQKMGKREIFFDVNLDFEQVKHIYITSKEISKQIVDYLKKNNIGITKTKISSDLNKHLTTIEKYLEALEDLNILYKEKISDKELYFLSEEFIN